MSEKHDPDQPANPSRRRLFTFFTDQEAAGEIGAELGRIAHDVRGAAPALGQVGQEMADALAEAAAPPAPAAPEPAPPGPAQPGPDDEPEIEAAAAALVERIEALGSQEAADAAQTRELLEAIAEQMQGLNARIDVLQQSPDVEDQAQARRLDKVRAGLGAAVTGALGYLATRTGEALYDGWVQENLLPLLPEWVRRPWEAFVRGEQPASPLVAPESPLAAPESPLAAPEAPLAAPEAQVQQTGHVGVPEMVFVPAGWFVMGSDRRRDPQAREEELPLHWVWLDAYWIGKYLVTNEQYAVFVRATGHRVPPHWYDGSIQKGTEAHPVTWVEWDEARAYCAWLSTRTRRKYRLPNEAEWEKAARGADGRIYPWGDQPPNDQLCNFGNKVGHFTPVGAYPGGASPCGALDMAGNVREWTSTVWGEGVSTPVYQYPYDARDGRERADARGDIRVSRGGTYLDDVQNVRCAARYRYNSDIWYPTSSGFRVAVS